MSFVVRDLVHSWRTSNARPVRPPARPSPVEGVLDRQAAELYPPASDLANRIQAIIDSRPPCSRCGDPIHDAVQKQGTRPKLCPPCRVDVNAEDCARRDAAKRNTAGSGRA